MSMRQINVLQTKDILSLVQERGLDAITIVKALQADNAWPTENEKIRDFRQMEVNQSHMSEISKKTINAVFSHYDVVQFSLI